MGNGRLWCGSEIAELAIRGEIQITRATYELIKNDFVCEARGSINVKGKGEMEIWQVKGKNEDPHP